MSTTPESFEPPISPSPPAFRRRTARGLHLAVLPFVVIVAITLILAWISLELLSASRSSIASEGISSRSHKDAVFDLMRYARTRDEAHFEAFADTMAAPLANRRARAVLLRPAPDASARAERARVAAAHPDEITRMVWVVGRFGGMPYMSEVIDTWAEIDVQVGRLAQVGERMRALVRPGTATPEALAPLVEETRDIYARLRPLDDRLAEALGHAFRMVHAAVFLGIALITLLLLLIAWFSTRRAAARTVAVERELAMSEREASAARERAEVTLRSIGDGVVTVAGDGSVDYLNPIAEYLTGWTNDEARGHPFSDVVRIVYEESRKTVPDPVTAVIAESRALRLRRPAVLLRRDGSEVAISESSAPITAPDGSVTGVVIVIRDVSRERRLAAQLSYQASHDALTGLVNRREFERRLEQALLAVSARGEQHALLYVDLDQFKAVNDTCGHGAGDELLRQIAGLLAEGLRGGDTLARLGGDEFGVLLENCALAAATRMAEDMRRRVEELRFHRDGRTFTIGASIGVVPLGSCPPTVRDALAAADRACYLAKDGGRNRVCVYDSGEDEVDAGQGERQWVERVQGALDEGRFELHCQPISPLRAARASRPSVEVFVRMREGTGMLVPPGLFIPAAERYGLMPRVDRWVIGEALDQLSRHAMLGRTLPLCLVNLSASTLSDPGLGAFVVEQFERTGVPFDAVCFELTESAATTHLAQAGRFMHEMRAHGCLFSLDDFGAGMASFGALRELPVDFLKVDGAFVRNISSDLIDAAMVEAVNRIGHAMGKRTIAPMVENDETREALTLLGVDFAQGYAIADVEPLARYLAGAPERAVA